jgi:hypothetical protein
MAKRVVVREIQMGEAPARPQEIRGTEVCKTTIRKVLTSKCDTCTVIKGGNMKATAGLVIGILWLGMIVLSAAVPVALI